jgi:arsenate reductase (glutaredoxin)
MSGRPADKASAERYAGGLHRWRSAVMSEHFPVVIHHAPTCTTSKAVLALIQEAGWQPTIIPFLETGWTRPQLQALFAAMGMRPREALREKGGLAAELGLLGPEVSDEAVLDAMVAHPILVNRPIVATPKGVRLCRPKELIHTLLDGGGAAVAA